MKHVKFERISIKAHPVVDEKWVQEQLAADPSLLGLGELVLKDKERNQPGAGRLDLLMQDIDATRRYEIEVQLGSTDESHIIRTIEYWDIERKRYPKYKHVAVIIAEDITSRFLNVISLFNAAIPLMAFQMSAYKSGEDLGLVFTKVLDQTDYEVNDDEEEVLETTDRAFWENDRGTKATVGVADEMLKLVKECDPSLELKYNKFYIGLAREGQANNFVVFRPRKEALRFEPRLPQTPETEKRVVDAGRDVMDYDVTWRRYRIRLQPGDVTKHQDILKQVVQEAYDASK